MLSSQWNKGVVVLAFIIFLKDTRKKKEVGWFSEERLMGGVGHKGTAVSIREGWDEPPGWVPALGMRGMRVRCPWGFPVEGGHA